MLGILILTSLQAFTQVENTSEVKARLLLIGNSGTKEGSNKLLSIILKWLPQNSNTRILFLGDNTTFQPNIFGSYAITEDPDRKNSIKIIAGEREWNNGKEGGYDSVLQVQEYLETIYGNKDVLLPKDGCPGPEKIKLSDDALLVFLNTQWWLHAYDKPDIESECPTRSKEQVYDELEKILRENEDKIIIVAGHHPLVSKGILGNHFSLKQHIFPFTDLHRSLYIPLPVVGSLYPIINTAFPSRQSLKHPVYESFINEVGDLLASHPHVLYVSSHEKNLQLLQHKNVTQLISGGGGKTRRASRSKESLYASSSPGFAVADVFEDKTVKISFYKVKNNDVQISYNEEVFNFSERAPLPDTAAPIFLSTGTTVSVAASKKYANPPKTREWLLGKNYRNVWSEPVNVPVFDMRTEKGGFTIDKIGGGKQTKSIHLKDTAGHPYKLRTIDKDPKEFLPPEFRSPLTRAIVNDMISTAHPYAPLVVAELAKKVGVVEAEPKYFFVPNDTAFAYYRPLFANKMAMLVDKDPPPFDNTKGSFEILNNITEKADHVVDQKEVLKARLLDILTGDFDRHMGQWSWGSTDTGKGKLYKVVPTDRDQAFFLSDGWLVKLVARKGLSLFKGFSYKINNVEGLGFSAEEFDRTFLNALDSAEWKQIIREFQDALPDDAIEDAVKKFPPEIYHISGKEIAEKLKTRRDDLLKKGMKYYRFISDNVNVLGSNQNDYFLLTQNEKGLQLQVHERKRNDTVMQIFSRTFKPDVTKEIRLYGLNGDDYFLMDSSVHIPITVRMIGGSGKDSFNIKGASRNYIYDNKNGENVIYKGKRSRNKMSDEPGINDYSVNSFAYKDQGGFPKIFFRGSTEYGTSVGVGWVKNTYSFRKEPFSTSNSLMVYYTPFRRSYHIQYNGVYNNLFDDFGLSANAELRDDAVMNFFGLGNNTIWSNAKEYPYYRIRYNYVAADLFLTKKNYERLSFAVGPGIYYYWNNAKGNENKIIASPASLGLDSSSVFSKIFYLGGKFRVDVNGLNNFQFPTQGMQWNNQLSFLQQVNGKNPFLSLSSDLILASPLDDNTKFVSLVKLGGAHIFSDKFEYFQAVGFGVKNNLRGFYNNRFLGKSGTYGSLELRYRLLPVSSFIVPGEVGVLGFSDIGRVWMKNTVSQKWHTAYGGGMYLFLFKRVLISASAGRNEDGVIYNFSLGLNGNLHIHK